MAGLSGFCDFPGAAVVLASSEGTDHADLLWFGVMIFQLYVGVKTIPTR